MSADPRSPRVRIEQADMQAIADRVLRKVALKHGSTTRRDFFVIETVLNEVADLASDEAQSTTSQEPIRVVVNGQPVEVPAGTVRSVIAAAIALSGQIGAPIAQWELRTREGDVIPHSLLDGGEWMLAGGKLLFLNLGLPIASDEAGKET